MHENWGFLRLKNIYYILSELNYVALYSVHVYTIVQKFYYNT